MKHILSISFIMLILFKSVTGEQAVTNVSDFVLKNYYYHYDICSSINFSFFDTNGPEDIKKFKIKEIKKIKYRVVKSDTSEKEISIIQMDSMGRIVLRDIKSMQFMRYNYELDSNDNVIRRFDSYVSTENINDTKYIREVDYCYSQDGLLKKSISLKDDYNQNICRYEDGQLIYANGYKINDCGKVCEYGFSKSFLGLFTYGYEIEYFAYYDEECKLLFDIRPQGQWYYQYLFYGRVFGYSDGQIKKVYNVAGNNYDSLFNDLKNDAKKIIIDTSYFEYYNNGLLKKITTNTQDGAEIELYEYQYYN